MMTRALLLALLLTGPRPLQKDLPVRAYKRVWSDEFNGAALDRTKWCYRGSGKRDDAYLSPAAIRLDGKGFLIIEARHSGDSILTGMIGTNGLFEIRYGYFECRASLTSTKGLYPAFWLQSPGIGEEKGSPATNGAELDIFEYFPNLRTDAVAHTLHYGGYGAAHQVAGPVWGLMQATKDGFHTFGLEWTPYGYTTFVDGLPTFKGNSHISHVPEFIVLSLGVNKLAAGPLDEKGLPDRFVIDYVRVYQKRAR
ncbi:glycoside hydrolase family 16 protein [Flavitalea sp. BT771]|uniref:glycoside hydrolase family 16 protein n=1 Tax=Flavitalea sp. BT771 TaxID=3063329 RepID=UPI0026E436D0|nr:glycoside hydrolase family 16 protein [Flavitalea sp. BT771]MDO6430412.1 glycoside hydrolase family 16 protein [Flavitalea sp. BT771]MDV6219448.1 glycoside hydrolase family 16 protein [Flavitalea sp. BT771]